MVRAEQAAKSNLCTWKCFWVIYSQINVCQKLANNGEKEFWVFFFFTINLWCCTAQRDVCTMDVNLIRLKLRLTSHSWLWPSFSSALFCSGRLVCACVCVCMRAHVCLPQSVCVVGELHGLSKEEVEAPVNDVSPLAGRGPPSSILKDSLSHLSYKRVERSATTHSHPILAFCFNERRELFRGTSRQVHRFDRVSTSADIFAMRLKTFIRMPAEKGSANDSCDSHI